jgi:hypothetical protein
LQAELNAETSARPIRIIGINETGHESGNVLIIDGRNLPWLQDTAAAGVWQSWAVTFRDVIILDGYNKRVTAFNLTTHDLADGANYGELRALLIDAANRVE